MARRPSARVLSTLLVAAGLLFGAILALPALMGWQRFTTFAPDGLYEVRAIATDGAGFTTTSNAVSSRVDNTAPTAATITNPGTPQSGTVTLNGTGADAVGLASMRFEYRLNGSAGAWSTACTDTSPPSPFSCSWDTTAVADGSYELRSVVVDQAGNTRSSTRSPRGSSTTTGPWSR